MKKLLFGFDDLCLIIAGFYFGLGVQSCTEVLPPPNELPEYVYGRIYQQDVNGQFEILPVVIVSMDQVNRREIAVKAKTESDTTVTPIYFLPGDYLKGVFDGVGIQWSFKTHLEVNSAFAEIQISIDGDPHTFHTLQRFETNSPNGEKYSYYDNLIWWHEDYFALKEQNGP